MTAMPQDPLIEALAEIARAERVLQSAVHAINRALIAQADGPRVPPEHIAPFCAEPDYDEPPSREP